MILDLDIRSDIHSLGVVLYEILTGSLPFEKARFEHVSYDEIRHILLEEEPVKPSTRVTACDDAASTVSNARGTTPLKLRHMLRGDLDLIVMKAIEKDRMRRYQTVNEFQHDVQCYLDHRPIMARPPSVLYRVKKYLHRNRRAVRFAATVLSLVGACVLVSILLIRVAAARHQSEMIATAYKNVRDAQENIKAGQTDAAFELLMSAHEVLPNDPQVEELLAGISCTWELHIEPRPDTIVLRRLDVHGSAWRTLDPSNTTFIVPATKMAADTLGPSDQSVPVPLDQIIACRVMQPLLQEASKLVPDGERSSFGDPASMK
jgi:hypothetical protein